MKHKHKFQLVSEIKSWYSSDKQLWLPANYKFVCECGKVKYVTEKVSKKK